MNSTTVYMSDGKGSVYTRAIELRGCRIVGVGPTTRADGLSSAPEPAPPSEVYWLGIRWEGKPWPKRVRARWPVFIQALPGCGCSKRAKGWLVSLKQSISRRWKAARSGA